ncbi:uncharacterized protein LOC126384796 [Epinephelus moara]|uniref:uncharacterized protein LOC126384796 n=1 Tax=Epinephelus moara TaxID=300413 RepID=UPI00214E4B6D|nr:uncharacterized protein LOC126384796 [Epinephelus moara]
MNEGQWDLDRVDSDAYKTERDVNIHVQALTQAEQPPDIAKLQDAFNRLITTGDTMCFKYWLNEALPEDVAYRYVCIPHVQGFWDHIVVGTKHHPATEKLVGHDDHLPKLFNVCLGSYRFHWCCFVLKKQIVLAMWCISVPKQGQPKVFTLVDTALRSITTSTEFKSMVFYLSRWFTAQYASPPGRQLHVVLDCKPSEGSSVVHIIALLASRSGMDSVALPQPHQRAKSDMQYTFCRKHANVMFTCPGNDSGNSINIVEEFNHYHNEGLACTGLTRVYTTSELYYGSAV